MNSSASPRGLLRVPLLAPALLLVPGLTAAALLSGPVRAAAAQQGYEYPDPFPGGYPSLAGAGGAGRMYMESYFPPPVTASPSYPAWSPDGEELAFAYQGRIWIVPVEGGTARQLSTGAGYHSQPSWSPDGRQVAYAADIDRNFDIFVVDVATGASRQLTDHPFLDLRPRWSPDGSRILFTTERDGTFDLWVYDLARAVAEPVIADPDVNDMAGDWVGSSGDIVFVSRRGEAALGSGSLWRWRAETGQSELLIRIETNYQAAPVVASHGGIVAYITDASGNNDLYSVPAEKSPRGIQPVRLTHTRTDEYFPSWSPDGERIAFARNGGTDDQPRTIDNGMGFALYTVGRGGGAPKRVRIDDYAWSQPTGRLRVRVTDSSGELLPSRIYLTGADGRAYFPHGSYPRVVSVTEDYYFHSDGSFTATLPVGEARLEAWRGFEYEPVYRSADVRAGEHATVEVQLDRWIDMAADGWYSGDNHIHPNYGGHYFITPEDLRNKAHSEDLNVANGMIANYWGNSRVEDLEHFLGHPHPHTGPRTIVYYNEEYRPSYFAHLSLLNLTELITPFYIGSVGTAHHALYPDNAHVLRRVHEQGGIGGYVHPFGLRHRDPDAAGAGSARELPVDAILGLADFVDVACIWSDELGTAEVWYRLLNTGSRIPGTAGTDVMSDIWRHPAVGTTRTYVHTGEDHLDYDAWTDAMAAGRAFVTSGPILTLDVSGKGMGEELQLSGGEVVTVSATARSLFPMHRMEIIRNGEIVHTVEATADGRSLGVELEMPVEGSGWIAARALGPPQHGAMDSYLFAHTNPVFLIADGEPIRSPEDAAFFVRWIDQVLDELRAMDRWDDPAHKDEVLATFEEGRRLYQAQIDDPDGAAPG
ncbi:MAG: LpqB family beta-propeller domain-containing protein [Gammaproteobacteria bacterium]|nr:LpqB family beta-propeller domain-containing protein [Gammaproteobacteria bacterium]